MTIIIQSKFKIFFYAFIILNKNITLTVVKNLYCDKHYFILKKIIIQKVLTNNKISSFN